MNYVLKVIDSEDSSILEKRSCGAFIIPMGREQEDLFCSEEGQIHLLKQTGLSRLIMTTINYGYVVEDI
jgi:hypothetical protein